MPRLVAGARRAALQEVVRSTFRVSVLVESGCREDAGAWAVLAPWLSMQAVAWVGGRQMRSLTCCCAAHGASGRPRLRCKGSLWPGCSFCSVVESVATFTCINTFASSTSRCERRVVHRLPLRPSKGGSRIWESQQVLSPSGPSLPCEFYLLRPPSGRHSASWGWGVGAGAMITTSLAMSAVAFPKECLAQCEQQYLH